MGSVCPSVSMEVPRRLQPWGCSSTPSPRTSEGHQGHCLCMVSLTSGCQHTVGGCGVQRPEVRLSGSAAGGAKLPRVLAREEGAVTSAGSLTAPPWPEAGQVVEVRGRPGQSPNAAVQGLPRSPADDGGAGPSPDVVSDLPAVSSRRGPALAEQLSVGLWELEVASDGHAPHRAALDRIDSQNFDGTAWCPCWLCLGMRCGGCSVTSSDPNRPTRAPSWSGCELSQADQLEPLRRSLVSSLADQPAPADDSPPARLIEAGPADPGSCCCGTEREPSSSCVRRACR